MRLNTRCCCADQTCIPGGYRYAEIEPQMLPEKFLSHSTDFAVPGTVSFWVRYEVTSCDEPNVVVEQETRIVQSIDEDGDITYETRQILEGDLGTLFMTDLGFTCYACPGAPGSYGTMSEPGSNRTTYHTDFFTDFGYQGDMVDSGSGVYRNYARNCFRVIVPTGGSPERPFLTEAEWLALSEYRIVFQSIGTDPGLVEEDSDVAQYGVHIFSDSSSVVFQELDCVPGRYSPLLHLIPYGVIGGFYFDEEAVFKTYDFKTYYHDQIGCVIPSETQGPAEVSSSTEFDPCFYIQQTGPGDMPSYEIIAVADDTNPPPGEAGHSLPFPTVRKFVLPWQTYSIDLPSLKHEFIYDADITCEEFYDGECEGADVGCVCSIEEFCHGVKPSPALGGYTGVGSTDAVQHGQRTVTLGNPLRNCLFVQGFKTLRAIFDPSRSYAAVAFSDPGSDNFEGYQYQVFSAGAANSILDDMNVGEFSFGSVSGNTNLPDPNGPGCGPGDIVFSLNVFNEFEESCECVQPTCSFLNFGVVDSPNFPSGVQGDNLILRTPGIEVITAGGFIDFNATEDNFNRGEDRVYGQPQIVFP